MLVDGGGWRGQRLTDSCRVCHGHGAPPPYRPRSRLRKSTCTSINHVVCHGIPNDKPLREGDIVNIDVTLILDGWHGDSSRMYPVGDGPAPGRAADRGHL